MTTDEQFNQLQERIKSLEQQVKDLEDKNENLAARLSDAEDAIWELEDRIDIEEYGDIDPEEEQRKLEEYFKATPTKTPWITEKDPEKLAHIVCDVRVHKCIAGWQFSDLPFMGFKLPETLEEIGFFVFNNCPNLRSIVIPTSVKTIGKAFCNNCPSLKTATFLCSCPENLTGAFADCTALEEIIVHEGEVEKYKTAMPGLTDKIHC